MGFGSAVNLVFHCFFWSSELFEILFRGGLEIEEYRMKIEKRCTFKTMPLKNAFFKLNQHFFLSGLFVQFLFSVF